MSLSEIKIQFIASITEINRNIWDHLINTDYPFIQYEFLLALEESNSVSFDTGWQPHHLVVFDQDELTGFMPLYLKTHSYGEYVFDFQWANAYQQLGLNYYPKLLTAIPFTPCAGPRLLLKNGLGSSVKKLIKNIVFEEVEKREVSSFHLLFPNEDVFKSDSDKNLQFRIGMQYHWYNNNYQNFEEFLNHCKMKSRKNIKRERKNITESDVIIKTIEGVNITNELWHIFYNFYCATYAKRSGNTGYLNESFFQMIGKKMPESLFMVVAERNNQPIAISLFFKDSQSLYGRYWGCSQEIEFLHFELCYYQGIEYCIKNKLNHFDAGAQGEHKIQRGFKPIETYSYHWIKDSRFRQAIDRFLEEEKTYMKGAIRELSEKLPFKK